MGRQMCEGFTSTSIYLVNAIAVYLPFGGTANAMGQQKNRTTNAHALSITNTHTVTIKYASRLRRLAGASLIGGHGFSRDSLRYP